jgi:phosphonatase-like hydrolase
MQTKLVVLDMAGTTVADDDAVANAFRKAFALHGHIVSIEDVKPLMGYKKTYAVKRVLELNNVDADQHLIDQIHADFVREMREHYETSPLAMPSPHAEDILKWLKQKGVRVAMNTGFPKEIADAIMKRFQWKEKNLVDDYIASDEVQAGRPQPYMIERLMKNGGVLDASDVVKVGDTEVDINEGRNAKCGLVVGITSGAFTRQQLEEYSPDHIIDDLSELKDLIA